MADVVAGAASLTGSLVLLTCGLAIRHDAFGIVSKNARLTAQLYGRLKDPMTIKQRVERTSRTVSVGFIAVGGAMAVIDALWVVAALL